MSVICNPDATGLSNCPKLSDNTRIKTVEYTVVHRFSEAEVFTILNPSIYNHEKPLQTRLKSMNSGEAVQDYGWGGIAI